MDVYENLKEISFCAWSVKTGVTKDAQDFKLLKQCKISMLWYMHKLHIAQDEALLKSIFVEW